MSLRQSATNTYGELWLTAYGERRKTLAGLRRYGYNRRRYMCMSLSSKLRLSSSLRPRERAGVEPKDSELVISLRQHIERWYCEQRSNEQHARGHKYEYDFEHANKQPESSGSSEYELARG